LENLPNHYTHTIYCEYVNTQLDEAKKKVSNTEAMVDEMEDAIM
jgi:hypothetical protein